MVRALYAFFEVSNIEMVGNMYLVSLCEHLSIMLDCAMCSYINIIYVIIYVINITFTGTCVKSAINKNCFKKFLTYNMEI